MCHKFIYVFDKESYEKLLALGYQLLKADLKQNLFVFENKEVFSFNLKGINCLRSDTLTF